MKHTEDTVVDLQATIILGTESSHMDDILEAIWQLYETDAEVSKAHYPTAEYFFYQGVNAANREREKHKKEGEE